MITLNDISAKEVLFRSDPEILKLVEEKGATSAEDVLKLMSEYPQYPWVNTLRTIVNTSEIMERANSKRNEPEQFFSKEYSDPSLDYQDTINKGNILLLDNPTHYQTRHQKLVFKPIKEIKIDLAHTAPDGRNYISANNRQYKLIGPSELPKIALAIAMYQDQIERQAKLTSDRNINLFYLDSDAKKDIVKQKYSEIVNFLIYNAESRMVWGELTDLQKKLYIHSTFSNSQDAQTTKNKMITYISDYTTLPELEKVADNNYKVLKRFIIK